jgi:hypothetical protein
MVMQREEILSEIEELGYPDGKSFGRSKQLSSLKEKIYRYTSFLPLKATTTFRLMCIISNVTNLPSCKKCGKNHSSIRQNENPTDKYDTYRFSDFCSRDCAMTSKETIEKRNSTIIEKYGDHNMRTEVGKNEYTNSIKKKYGKTSVMHVQSIKDKSLKCDNGEWRISTQECKAKIQETFDKKYDGHPMYDREIKTKAVEKRKKNFLNRYGVTHESKLTKTNSALSIWEDDVKFKQLCDELVYPKLISRYLGYTISPIHSRMAELGISLPTKSSLGEIEIIEFIRGICPDVVIEQSERNVLDGKELDIYLPEKKFAIEFNGLYWHSENFKDKNYHKEKSLLCMENDIQLMHVWQHEWDDDNKKSIIKRMIAHKLGVVDERIYARKCIVRVDIDSKTAMQFLENNHLQGKIRSTHKLGLFYGDEMVALLCLQYLGDGVYDISRFATSKAVVGGFSKLLKYFLKNNQWNEIRTYASLDHSHGNVYSTNGFTNNGHTPPNYFYYNSNGKVISRYQAMKHRLGKILENFDQESSEHENMNNHGFHRVYDSGSLKFSMYP